jgi:DNA helicase II / ATP-dependent DNA helicase PcrA
MDGLDPEQRLAVACVSGPLVVKAGPGTGKTRVVTHRIAEQVRRDVVAPSAVLAVTFTDKAAREMRARLRHLGIPAGGSDGVRAATFHSAALTQVGYFWPRVSGATAPDVLGSKGSVLGPLIRRLRPPGDPGIADLAAEIEWVKAQGVTAVPDGAAGGGSGPLAALDLDGEVPRWRLDPIAYEKVLERHDGPWPRDVAHEEVAGAFARLFDAYEDAKAAAARVDFDDMLAVAGDLVRNVPEVAERVRDRYTHLTVDEFQDTSRLQWELLTAWLGERDDACVVGDADQAIYGFTGASPSYLGSFLHRFPHATVVELATNYRSTQPICDLAAKMLRSSPLRAAEPATDRPVLRELDDEESERAWVIDRCRALHADGVDWQEMAILYRFNAQSEAWETALADAGIPFRVAGDEGFFSRRHVEQAVKVLASAERAGVDQPDRDDPLVALEGADPVAPALPDVVTRVLRDRMAWAVREPEGQAALERWRDLGVLVELAEQVVERYPDASLGNYLAEIRRRAAAGSDPDGGGVALLTLHRAKGLEFDAVFVVSAEEGRLPSRHAIDHDKRHDLGPRDRDARIPEERRLFYVGLTRARRYLHVTWVHRGRKKATRFLRGVGGPARQESSRRTGGSVTRRTTETPEPLTGDAAALFESLREWRLARAMRDGVPAYVVFPDTTLREIAVTRPSTTDALLSVNGVGKKKLGAYGDEVLELVGGAG